MNRFAPGAAEPRLARERPPAAPEHCEDPQAEYEHATSGCAFFRRADRGLLRTWGRAPRRMLHGMLTNRVPSPPRAADPAPGARWDGQRTYGAVLTRKGRMLSDVRAFWLGPSEDAGIALDAAMAGRDALLRHFAKYLPPRLAKIEDLAAATGLLTVTGERAAAALDEVLGGSPADGYWLLAGGVCEGGVAVARGLEQAASWDVWARTAELEAVAAGLQKAGACPAGRQTWETLRVEAGYPAFGADMDESVIPIEAGLERRAFDHEKGCYTGQEVIVRLLHRGHVNWRLRALRFGDAAGDPGSALFRIAGGKACGRVTSCVRSPKFGEWIGMGYVRREVEPPAVLRLGSPGGPRVSVAQLPPEAR